MLCLLFVSSQGHSYLLPQWPEAPSSVETWDGSWHSVAVQSTALGTPLENEFPPPWPRLSRMWESTWAKN